MLHAYITFIRCRLAETEEILDRAIEHAQRTDSRRLVADLLHVRARAALRGPTTVTAAMEWCEAARELNAGRPRPRRVRRGELAVLEAMRGRFDEARTLSAEAERILLDLGRTLALAFVRADAGAVELLAGNAGTASAILRSACDTLVEIGERGNLSTYAALLAEALADQGDDDGADKYALLSEDTALREDIQSQVLWRNARTRICAVPAISPTHGCLQTRAWLLRSRPTTSTSRAMRSSRSEACSRPSTIPHRRARRITARSSSTSARAMSLRPREPASSRRIRLFEPNRSARRAVPPFRRLSAARPRGVRRASRAAPARRGEAARA
jgi:hypothetical protein